MEHTPDSVIIDQKSPKQSPASMQERRALTVRTLTTDAEFDQAEKDWSDLVESSNATIYQTYEWLRTWWKYFSTSRDTLSIFTFYHRELLVGIIPLYSRASRILGIPYARQLQFIGHGLSDYCEVIARPGYEHEVLTSFVSHLRSTRRAWDILDLEDVNESAVFFGLLPGILQDSRFRMVQYQGNVCPQISLPASGLESAKNFDPAKSEHYKRKLKRLQQNFKAVMETVEKETDDIERSIDAFAFIHGQRWKNLGYPSAFDDDHLKTFHIEFSRKFAHRGWLKIFFLYVNDEPVAVSYTFYYKRRAYMYHSNAHGTDEIMRCSPGFLIRNAALVEAINLKMEIFDYLRGDEPYKYKEWKAVDSKNYLLRIISPSVFSQLRLGLFFLNELLQKARVRTQRELFEYKRFRIIKHRSLLDKTGYLTVKSLGLGALGINFILRHLPVQALRKYQLKQRSFHEEVFSNAGDMSKKRLHPGEVIAQWWSSAGRELRSSRIAARVRLLRYGETLLAHDGASMDHGLRVIECGSERRLMVGEDHHPVIFSPRSEKELKREYWGELLRTPFSLASAPNILILGGGGTPLVRLVAGGENPAHVIILEKNPRIVEYAKEFFNPHQSTIFIVGDMKSSLRKLQGDGSKFDLIIDTAGAETTSFSKDHEVTVCRQYLPLLTPVGMIAMRRVHDHRSEEDKLSLVMESLRQLKLEVVKKEVRERWDDDILYIRPASGNGGT